MSDKMARALLAVVARTRPTRGIPSRFVEELLKEEEHVVVSSSDVDKVVAWLAHGELDKCSTLERCCKAVGCLLPRSRKTTTKTSATVRILPESLSRCDRVSAFGESLERKLAAALDTACSLRFAFVEKNLFVRYSGPSEVTEARLAAAVRESMPRTVLLVQRSVPAAAVGRFIGAAGANILQLQAELALMIDANMTVGIAVVDAVVQLGVFSKGDNVTLSQPLKRRLETALGKAIADLARKPKPRQEARRRGQYTRALEFEQAMDLKERTRLRRAVSQRKPAVRRGSQREVRAAREVTRRASNKARLETRHRAKETASKYHNLDDALDERLFV